MIVKLKKKNSRYRDLTLGQPYAVIGIEADDYRILNDGGRPFLYPKTLFTKIDSEEPSDWVTNSAMIRNDILTLPRSTNQVSLKISLMKNQQRLPRSGI